MAFDLARLLKINNRNLSDVEFSSNILEGAPLLARLHAQEASNGTNHSYLRQSVAGGAGFRVLNDGIAETSSDDEEIDLVCKLMDASFTVDLGYVMKHKDGLACLDKEGARKIRSGLSALEKQVFYGVGANAGGFPGLSDNASYNALNDNLVVNAGGAAAGTGSSAWLIRTAEDDVSLIGGKGGNMEWGESVVTRVVGTNGPYAAYYTPIMGWFGLQLGSTFCAVRIANLTEDAGKGMTDALVAKAISKFPVEKRNNLVLAYSRRSEAQLQASRTATTTTGAPAPFPTESHGVPLITTDSIRDNETLLA